LASYQAALWGGIQDIEFNDSVQSKNEAIDSRQRADGLFVRVQAIFLELVNQWVNSPTESVELFLYGEGDIAGLPLGNMAEDGALVTETWFFDAIEGDDDAEISSYPFDDLYFDTLQEEAIVIDEVAAQQSKDARRRWQLRSMIMSKHKITPQRRTACMIGWGRQRSISCLNGTCQSPRLG